MARRSKASQQRILRAVAVLLVIVLIAAAVFSVYWFVVKGKSWDDFKALFQ